MNLAEIESNVAELDLTQGFNLLYDLLLSYGLPKASITRLRKGSYNRSKTKNERLWKGKVFYRYVENSEIDLHSVIDEAQNDAKVTRERPRFLIVRDAERLLAVDTRTGTTLDIPLVDLSIHSAFFMPWAGIEKAQLESLNYADVKAAEKMARLYDEIVKHNAIQDETDIRNLNVFFSRLLFCFFAEDTRVFENGSFTDAIASLTQADGSDTGAFLDQLFEVLDTETSARGTAPSHFQGFGYVNGRLFAEHAPAPTFSAKARRLTLECGTLDWSEINPDIFGSMIQAVVQPSQREGLGIHYTSVENIMKVIRPLFLDDLEDRFDKADTVRKLEGLLDHICAIKVFDPACGSGNFLVIAYKELRKLEHRILQRMGELDPNTVGMFKLSGIKLDHFYGIEIDDFAHEIAILSLWLAKHQMNVEFHELFGVEISLIPLKDTGNVVCGNAARLQWDKVCVGDARTYVCGNPPYRGSRLQTAEQKDDFVAFFGSSDYPQRLDYIAIWFLKGAAFTAKSGGGLGFVSTSSVSQGDHVGLMWPMMLDTGIQVSFAHEPFPWSNRAKGKAAVTCVIIGLSASPPPDRKYYSSSGLQRTKNISPYLKPVGHNTIVRGRAQPANGLLPMKNGSAPRDGGYLSLTRAERDRMLKVAPEASEFLRKYLGSRELLEGLERFCLWIPDERARAAADIPVIKSRLDAIRALRLKGGKSKQSVADTPHRFAYRAHRPVPAVVVPSVSSERRQYIPIGFTDGTVVVSNAAFVVYSAEPWLFGLLHSRMHMVWVNMVCSRLKTDYQYSVRLGYNVFPTPTVEGVDLTTLNEPVFDVLSARERFADRTLAELYDPDKIPPDLERAHERVDAAVDSLYQSRTFGSDGERLELLLSLYEQNIESTYA